MKSIISTKKSYITSEKNEKAEPCHHFFNTAKIFFANTVLFEYSKRNKIDTNKMKITYFLSSNRTIPLKTLRENLALEIKEVFNKKFIEEDFFLKGVTDFEDQPDFIKELISKDVWNEMVLESKGSLLVLKSSVNQFFADQQKQTIFFWTQLLKQQKRHATHRFYKLVNYYTSFVNAVFSADQIFSEKFGKEGLLSSVVLKILEGNSLEKKTSELTIDLFLHRHERLMGKFNSNDLDTTTLMNKLNYVFEIKKERIVRFEKTHTLPFPSFFSWNKDKIRDKVVLVLNERVSKSDLEDNDVSANEKQEVYLSRFFFQENHELPLSAEIIEETACSALNNVLLNEKENLGNALFHSVKIIGNLYIKIFSEMQNLPDFINREVDGCSEWRDTFSKKNDPNSKKQPELENNFKKEISRSIAGLIQKKVRVDESDTCEALRIYLDKTEINIESKLNQIKTQNRSILNSIKEICLLQKRQSLLRVRHHFKVKKVNY